MKTCKWLKLVGKRLLLTDRITQISRDEWTLLEISTNGEVGKFRNELADSLFWTDLRDLELLEELPTVSPPPTEPIPATRIPSVYIVRTDDFRSSPGVNGENDMRRVVLDMTQHDWRTLRKMIGL